MANLDGSKLSAASFTTSGKVESSIANCFSKGSSSLGVMLTDVPVFLNILLIRACVY